MAIECTGEKENISVCDDDEKHMWHKESGQSKKFVY